MPSSLPWLTLNSLIGLARVIQIQAGFPQLPFILVAAFTLLPVLPVAIWQSRHRRWIPLLCSDALTAGILTALSLLVYSQMLLWNVVAVLAFAVIPRGLITEGLMRVINLAKGAVNHD